MNNYKVFKWEDVLTIKNGKDQKKVLNSNGQYPVYGSGGIIGYADDFICKEGTTIIGRKGSINNPIFVNEKFWNVDTAFGLCPGPMIDSKYLFYFCTTYNFLKHNKATTLPSLTKNDLLKIQIPLPPLEIQEKIVAILDAADEYRQKTRALIEKYDQLAQSLFLEMFGDPVRNEKGWELVKFGEYIDILTDYHANGSYEILEKNVKLKNIKDYALMVRTTDLEKNDFVNDVIYVSETAYNFLEKSKVFGGEIIINKIGSAGKVFLMPHLNKPVTLGMNAFLLRFKAILNNTFVYFLLKSKYGEYQIQNRVKGAVTKTIRKDAIREIPIIFPPLTIQNQFAERIQIIESQKQQAQASLQKAEEMFNSLLQRAFKGELV